MNSKQLRAGLLTESEVSRGGMSAWKILGVGSVCKGCQEVSGLERWLRGQRWNSHGRREVPHKVVL